MMARQVRIGLQGEYMPEVSRKGAKAPRVLCGFAPVREAAVVLALFGVPLVGAADTDAGRGWTVVVKETAGIRRFGYPVLAVIALGQPGADAEHFQLLENGRPVVAQFRPQGDRAVALDFTVNHAPLETRTYTVTYDPQRSPLAPRNGLKVETADGEIRVIHPPDLEFIMPRDLFGLLRQVRTRKEEYLRPGSAGLTLRTKDGGAVRAGSRRGAAKVVKSGPLAVQLRFEGAEALPNGRQVRSVVDLDFPLSKSWVGVTWNVEDPNNEVVGLGADLNLNVGDGPTLVDFGASTYVYAALRPGQTAVLRQGGRDTPRWQTLLGKPDALLPYVVATPGAAPAEGWAHIMDRKRCTAVAVEGFAEAGGEKRAAEIAVTADGRLQLWKLGGKRLRFLLHFVGMPMHVGAATSPQAMLTPLHVEVRRKQ
jgi:hypothetical protein